MGELIQEGDLPEIMEEAPHVDWEREFQLLVEALGGEMISSTTLFFVLSKMRSDGASREAQRRYVLGVAGNRSSQTQEFMG